MGIGGLNVGRDVQLTILGASGPVLFQRLIGFSSKQDTVRLKSRGLDGIVRNVVIPDGWSGSFEYDRIDGSLDVYFGNYESSYYAGSNLPNITIDEVISNPDGSVTNAQYIGVAIELEDAGDFKQNELVRVRVRFECEKRIIS